MVQHQTEITKLWKQLALVASQWDLPTQFAAVAVLVAEMEFSNKEFHLLFDTFLAFSRHITGEMEIEDMARN